METPEGILAIFSVYIYDVNSKNYQPLAAKKKENNRSSSGIDTTKISRYAIKQHFETLGIKFRKVNKRQLQGATTRTMVDNNNALKFGQTTKNLDSDVTHYQPISSSSGS